MDKFEALMTLLRGSEPPGPPVPPPAEPGSDVVVWEHGENYMIRTVTMILTGRLVAITPMELVLMEAAWIAETNRFADSVKTGEFAEVEPFPDDRRVIVGRGAIVDAVTIPTLPREQK